ncbi:MAG: class I SAM-dependent methyltransferase [Pedosphaera sp.]|nr:class I SAM-dependent methyltransferase [Pedosphaera sp.]
MRPTLAEETERLKKSWMQHDSAMLRDYMVADIHDPRINPQSILGRHFLIEALFSERFSALCMEELRFSTVVPWLRTLAGEAIDADEAVVIEHALKLGADNAEGRPIPSHVIHAFNQMPVKPDGSGVPNHVHQFFQSITDGAPAALALEKTFGALETVWRAALADVDGSRISVLEPACGSANDYRTLESCGLARFLEYTGFDLCEKNVTNARQMFPAARFEVENVFELPYSDKAFDCCVVHDLLEHLSIEGMETALAELCRVTRRGISVGFFQMHQGPDHIVRPLEDYHWNTLSLPQVYELFARHGAKVQAMHINTFLNTCFGCADGCYYDSAYTLCVRFD